MSTVLGNMWGLQAGFVEQVDEATTFPVVVTPGVEELALTWDLQTGIQFYRIWCGLSPDRLVLVADGVTDPEYTIGSLLAGQQYFVQVTGVVSPRLSIGSVTDDGTGTMVATQLLPFVPAGTECIPLDQDICFMNGNNPQTEEDDVSGSVDYGIDWGDDSTCGLFINGAIDAAFVATITHTNIPVNQRKSRRVNVFPNWTDTRPAVQIISSPVPAGDPMPDNEPGGWISITILFTSDCAGALTATVTYNSE